MNCFQWIMMILSALIGFIGLVVFGSVVCGILSLEKIVSVLLIESAGDILALSVLNFGVSFLFLFMLFDSRVSSSVRDAERRV